MRRAQKLAAFFLRQSMALRTIRGPSSNDHLPMRGNSQPHHSFERFLGRLSRLFCGLPVAEAVGGVGMNAPPNSTAAGGSSRPTFAIAIISLSVRASDKRPPIGILLQRPARL